MLFNILQKSHLPNLPLFYHTDFQDPTLNDPYVALPEILPHPS